MSRVTLRLPETLHEQLRFAAEQEGISINQYIVYALAKQTAPKYHIHQHSQGDITKQQHSFESYLSSAPKATAKEVKDFLNQRPKSHETLDPAVVATLQKKIRSSN
jgi:uncharacterized protein (DUF1778 family)